MNKIELNNLNNELIKWFNTIDKSDKNFWNRNNIAKTIKENLIKWGHFKQIVGGNPSKGYKKMKITLARRDGYDGPFEENY